MPATPIYIFCSPRPQVGKTLLARLLAEFLLLKNGNVVSADGGSWPLEEVTGLLEDAQIKLTSVASNIFGVSGRQMLVGADDLARCAFEMKPGEITRPSADQRLGKGEERYKETGGDRVELRFDSRAQHVRDRHAERAAEHQIGNDPEGG